MKTPALSARRMGVGVALVMGATACLNAPGSPPANESFPGDEPAVEGSPTEALPIEAVRPGIDVLLTDSLHLVEGMRVGLITNHTGLDRSGILSMDRLHDHPAVELVALFSPEHGIRGTAGEGEAIASGVDPRTEVTIHSLYGQTVRPTPEMLEGIDVLLFDIQDIGTRYYTYIYTMAHAMEAAGEAGIPFVVLDRPNPVGGELVQGNRLDPAFASFVGRYPIPMRHGMTTAELARLFRGEFGVEVELHVVPMTGWKREALFPATELPWRAPSLNMPDLESALHYPGTCLFEGTNLSVGRGTQRAFQWVGAPWLDGDDLAARMESLALPGVRFEAARFTPERPSDGKFAGVELGGVRLVVTDPAVYDPTLAGVALLIEARALSGDRWEWNRSHFDRLAGTDRLRLGIEAGLDLAGLRAEWEEESGAFRLLRDPYLLYR